MKKPNGKVFSAIFLAFCLIGIASKANATTATFDLTGTNDPGMLACNSATPCVQVILSTSGNHATFSVSSLLTGWVIDRFGFNAESGSPLTVIPLTLGTGSNAPTGEINAGSSHFGLSGAGNEDGWGTFNYNFGTGENGGSSGGDCMATGGVPGVGCTFSFTVLATSTLTLADFEIPSLGGNGSGFFADHMASATKSGYAGSTVLLPEPATLTLFGSGFLGIAALIRQRRLGVNKAREKKRFKK